MQFTIDTPNPKQLEFMKCDKKYIAYGGARGGGKSWALRKKLSLLALAYDGIVILLLRRSYPELRENHINPLLSDLNGIAYPKEHRLPPAAYTSLPRLKDFSVQRYFRIREIGRFACAKPSKHHE